MDNAKILLLVNEYRGNIWELKRRYETASGEEKNELQYAWYKIMDEKSSWIGIQAKFSSPPFFPHSYHGIFVSNGATIGKNAVIFHQVTIGSNSLDDSPKKGSPIIGDNVYIGAGAKIIGRVKIGNNCRIGANAVVTFDVPDNSVVVLEHPRVITKQNMDNKFYNWQNGVYGYHLNGQFIPVVKNIRSAQGGKENASDKSIQKIRGGQIVTPI